MMCKLIIINSYDFRLFKTYLMTNSLSSDYKISAIIFIIIIGSTFVKRTVFKKYNRLQVYN